MRFMKRTVLAFVLLLIPALAIGQSCPPGGCPKQGRQQPSQRVEMPPHQAPAGGFNIEYPAQTGRYASAVRIACRDRDGSGSLGSGVVVRWGGRVVVITARHVVQDARKVTVVIISSGKKFAARVLTTSPWDVAILQTETPIEGDVAPSSLVTSEELSALKTESLTSAGFGNPSSKFCTNTGRFIGYISNNAVNDGCSDWIVISGPARAGDSGGPIYTPYGKVAGILWGTDGSTVVGVNAPRLGLTLNEALKNYIASMAPGGPK